MVLGRGHAISLLGAAHNPSSMRYDRGLCQRAAVHVLAHPAAPRPASCPSPRFIRLHFGAGGFPRVMRQDVGSKRTSSTWDPSLGIGFSPDRERTPYHPSPNICRFLHVAATDGSSINGQTGPAALLEQQVVGRNEAVLREASIPPESPRTSANDIGDTEGMGVNAVEEISNKNQVEPVVPPRTSLGFNISTDLFNAARAAPADSLESFWSHTMYQKITEAGAVERVQVHYCLSKNTMERVCSHYFLGQEVLGFDLEWSPFATRTSGPRQSVSLIQLASPSRIGLFHVACFATDDFIAPSFRKIMEDSAVSKVGVNISADCTRLNKALGVKAQGVFELSHLYKLVKYLAAGSPGLINRSLVALSTQVQEYLGLPLYKGSSVRSSDWMNLLSSQQMLYSASDAYAGIQLYHVLEAKRLELTPCPPRPYHAELGLPIRIPVPEPEREASRESDQAASMDPYTKSPDVLAQTLAEVQLLESKVSKPASPKSKPRDARITAAELRVKQHISSKQTPVLAKPAALRAYYIWDANEELDPESIARLLRDPPLKIHTVSGYILDAITTEKLPYAKARLKTEVLSLLHPASMKRHRSLVEECGLEPQKGSA